MKRKNQKKIKRAAHKTQLITIALFAGSLTAFTLLGGMLPLRPTESQMEKRTLTEFPEITLSGVLDGSFFSDVSKWYSDSYPLRDTWMSAYDVMTEAFGLRTTRIITGDSTADEIPDFEPETENALLTRTAETQEQTLSDAAKESMTASATAETIVLTSAETDLTTAVTAETAVLASAETDLTTAVAGEMAASTSAEADFTTAVTEPQTQSASTEETEEAVTKAESFEPITGQTVNGMLVNGDTAYGIYYFNRQAADTYIETVNRTAENLKGQAQVYCLLIPISSSIYFDIDDFRAIIPDASDELKAIEYYYSQLSDLVTDVKIVGTLEAHRDEYLYFRTDHHWTATGAYYAYEQFAKVKGITANPLSAYEKNEYPGFLGSYYVTCKSPALESNPDTVVAYTPLTYNRMHFVESDGAELDWPIVNDVSGYSTTQKYSCFAGSDNPFSVINNPNVTNGETLLIVKESYGNAMIPFLTDHYQTIYWFDYRSYNGNITEFARENGVTEVLFVNGTEPISSVDMMNRLSGLLP